MKWLFQILLLFFLFVCNQFGGDVKAQQIAFPGAEGYGRYASGGRGGRVVEVTTLKDMDSSGNVIPGSFRGALMTEGNDPITIVFKVSGVINLSTPEIRSNRSNMTIAGQSAPGDGICIRGGMIDLSGCKNVIIRYIRFRPGDEKNALSSALRFENCETFIVDHCSMSWSTDEVTYFANSRFLTVQWCLISESLYNTIHRKGTKGYAAQWGGQYASYHHNLLAHHNSHMPRLLGSNKNDIEALVDYRNNVNFNWRIPGAFCGGECEASTDSKGFAHTNVVNNYFKPGPATADSHYFVDPNVSKNGNTVFNNALWYIHGNVMEGDRDKSAENWTGIHTHNIESIANIRSDEEFDYHKVNTETARKAYQSVLLYAGATKPKRDKIDNRIIGEVKGTLPIKRSEYFHNGVSTPVLRPDCGIIDTPFNLRPKDAPTNWNPWDDAYTSIEDPSKAPPDSDHDGMPDAWEKKNKLNPYNPADRNRKNKEGYTNLEVYLNQLADKASVVNGKQYRTIRLRTFQSKSLIADL